MFYLIFFIDPKLQAVAQVCGQTCLVGRIQRDAGCSIGRNTGCPEVLRDFLLDHRFQAVAQVFVWSTVSSWAHSEGCRM